jgi:hypothetical protein
MPHAQQVTGSLAQSAIRATRSVAVNTGSRAAVVRSEQVGAELTGVDGNDEARTSG